MDRVSGRHVAVLGDLITTVASSSILLEIPS